ncbi:MAG: 16S rRNA pseudouridine(516) synthase [Defluviitaleaceae bacterium]|nr:16S rRNA pseudouridine(516) synthase [Defluviitaleaceae bacterium]
MKTDAVLFDKPIRLDKYLADAGEGSRSQARALIRGGAIRVNGAVVSDEGYKLSPGSEVTLSGRPVVYKKWIYLMLNKPPGVISASEGEKRSGDMTVIDLLEARYRNKGLFPVGRLDKDTTGLLLITNDGAFAHNTLSPKRHVEKVYEAEVDGILGGADIAAFRGGIVLENGEKCQPARLEILSARQARITLNEGKYHQIKRMFEAAGKRVTALKRVSFGAIALDGSLAEGEARELNEKEMEWVSEYAGD